jgi:ribonucleotide monophosphatase NagD (HAD superfamily)
MIVVNICSISCRRSSYSVSNVFFIFILVAVFGGGGGTSFLPVATTAFGGVFVVSSSRLPSSRRSSPGDSSTDRRLLALTAASTSSSSSFTMQTTDLGDPGSSSSSSSGIMTNDNDTNNSNSKKMILLNGVRDLVDSYNVFLLDMWGVLHDGTRPYAGVLDAVQQLRRLRQRSSSSSSDGEPHNKRVVIIIIIILSNSSKRLDNSLQMLQKLGFDPRRDFDQVITSGDVAWQMLYATGAHAASFSSSSSTTINDQQTSGNRSVNDDKKATMAKSSSSSNNSNNNNNNLLAVAPWSVLVDIHQDLVKQQQGGRKTGNTQHNVFVLGSGDGDEEYCRSAGWTLSSIQEASLIVARGTFTINDGGSGTNIIDRNVHGEQAYQDVLHERLAQAARRKLPMLVTNPDKIRPDADCSPMPGQIGDLYEQALLDNNVNDMNEQEAERLVKRIGKPDLDVYQIALSISHDDGGLATAGQQPAFHHHSPPPRAIMIGDALETDITGGTLAGIDTAWVLLDGIHSSELLVDTVNDNDIATDSNDSHGNDAAGSDTVVANKKEKENRVLVKKAGVVLETFNSKKGTYAKDRQLTPTMLLKHFCW